MSGKGSDAFSNGLIELKFDILNHCSLKIRKFSNIWKFRNAGWITCVTTDIFIWHPNEIIVKIDRFQANHVIFEANRSFLRPLSSLWTQILSCVREVSWSVKVVRIVPLKDLLILVALNLNFQKIQKSFGTLTLYILKKLENGS